jgi:hypothetical protein
MVASPSVSRSRAISRSRLSRGCFCIASWPASSKASRHVAIRAAGIPSSRATTSQEFPRAADVRRLRSSSGRKTAGASSTHWCPPLQSLCELLTRGPLRISLVVASGHRLYVALPKSVSNQTGHQTISSSPTVIRRRLLLLCRRLVQVSGSPRSYLCGQLLKLPWPGHRAEILPEECTRHQPTQHSTRQDRKHKGEIHCADEAGNPEEVRIQPCPYRGLQETSLPEGVE